MGTEERPVGEVIVIGVDPGDTTGWFSWRNDTDETRALQLSPDDAVHYCRLAATLFPRVIIACERFVITPKTAKKKGATKSAPGVLQALRMLPEEFPNVEFISPGASETKNFAPNERLKQFGFYTPAMRHANDAARCVIFALATKLRSEFEKKLMTDVD